MAGDSEITVAGRQIHAADLTPNRWENDQRLGDSCSWEMDLCSGQRLGNSSGRETDSCGGLVTKAFFKLLSGGNL